MPGPDNKLAPEEREKIDAWVKTHWQNQDIQCPICKSAQWSIADHIVQPVTMGGGGGLQLGGVSYPYFMIMSVPCGYTLFINAVIAGVLPSAQNAEVRPKPG